MAMSLFLSLLMSPVLMLISIPLASFAALTSILAFSTLSLRVVVVYADLAGVLIQNQFAGQRTSNRASKSPSKYRHSRRPSIKHRQSGSSQGSSHTLDLSGLGAYGNGDPTRDFEGIGGWRDPGSDDEDLLWTQMNNRLQLPVRSDSHQRHHHRSRTSSSLVGLPLMSPSPTHSTVMTPTKAVSGRPSSPEEYFAHRKMSKSATSLDTANMGRTISKHKPSSSSGSSVGSIRATLPPSFGA